MKFNIHYSKEELKNEIDKLNIPENFLWGTATAGYQVEGGFNAPDDPKNNWYYLESTGKREKTGSCSRFWELYKEDISMAHKIGLDAFRMGIEWARIQPSKDPESKTIPPFDEEAIRKYARIISAVIEMDMTPVITLFHFVHPLWAGLDFWLERNKVEDIFVKYIETSITKINEYLIEEFKKHPIPFFTTINEPLAVPLASYMLKVFPHGQGKAGKKAFLVAFENQLIAHCLAYKTIHRIYKEKGWPTPTVTFNSWSCMAYHLDKMTHDIMLAQKNNIQKSKIYDYLNEQREMFEDIVDQTPLKRWPKGLKDWVEGFLRKRISKMFGPEPLTNLVDIIYSEQNEAPQAKASLSRPDIIGMVLSRRDKTWLDALSFDYYDPFLGNNFDIQLPQIIKIRTKPWDWNVVPIGLGYFLKAYSLNTQDIPIYILENGMCYRAKDGGTYKRFDNAIRDDVLKAHIYECFKALNSGIKLRGYFYWSLVDNYEWGSFEPRFGLFGVDYSNGAKRYSRDIIGNNTAGAYSEIIKAFKKGDKQVLIESFLKDEHQEIK